MEKPVKLPSGYETASTRVSVSKTFDFIACNGISFRHIADRTILCYFGAARFVSLKYRTAASSSVALHVWNLEHSFLAPELSVFENTSVSGPELSFDVVGHQLERDFAGLARYDFR